jgi:DNA-directed RNA polymerase specialized sigma24 family protein
MTDATSPDERTGTSRVAAALPFLRRHARALTGSQQAGDRYAAATLEALLERETELAAAARPELSLFGTFYSIWQSSGAHLTAIDGEDGPRAQAQRHLSRLTPRSREALLLHTVEQFSMGDVAAIMDVPVAEAEDLVDIARREMHDAVRGRVLIIEDEPMISMDLEAMVQDMGHEVCGTATTRDEAVAKGRETGPDLVLADIHLADDSSGIDAVNDLLGTFPEMPVIFITAFPERLLSGERPEPPFLITKPFAPPQVFSAISQAMFFASTETLRA